LKWWRDFRPSGTLTIRYLADRRGYVLATCPVTGQDLAPRLVCPLGKKLCSRRTGHSQTKIERSERALVALPFHRSFTVAHLGTKQSEAFNKCHTRVRQRVCYDLRAASCPPGGLDYLEEWRAEINHASCNTSGYRSASGYQGGICHSEQAKDIPSPGNSTSFFFFRFSARLQVSTRRLIWGSMGRLLHGYTTSSLGFFFVFQKHICTCSMRSMDGVLSHSSFIFLFPIVKNLPST
jgi:hypothetical protein